MGRSTTRAELYELVWSMPMLKVGERYAVSSSYLKRLCDKHAIPTPPQGHWNKIAHGKATASRPALGKLPNRKTIWIEGSAGRLSSYRDPQELSLSDAQARVQRSPTLGLRRHMHPLVCLIISADKELRKSDHVHWEDRYRKIAARSLENPRRYALISKLMFSLEEMSFHIEKSGRDYEARYSDGSRSSIRFSFSEKLRKLTFEELQRRRSLHPRSDEPEMALTGHLRLELTAWPPGPAPQRWEEPRKSIEAAFYEILAAFEVHRHTDRLFAASKAREAEAAAERKRIEEAKEERKARDGAAWRLFEDRASDWRRVADLRAFLAEIEGRGLANSEMIEGRPVSDWLRWARERIDALDPLKDDARAAFRELLPPDHDQ